MSMKVSEFNGQPAIYIRWHTRKPEAGAHLSLYENDDPVPYKRPVGRLIIKECLHSQQHKIDKNQTEEWWSFEKVTEYEFHRMRHSASRLDNIAQTHDSLF